MENRGKRRRIRRSARIRFLSVKRLTRITKSRVILQMKMVLKRRRRRRRGRGRILLTFIPKRPSRLDRFRTRRKFLVPFRPVLPVSSHGSPCFRKLLSRQILSPKALKPLPRRTGRFIPFVLRLLVFLIPKVFLVVLRIRSFCVTLNHLRERWH